MKKKINQIVLPQTIKVFFKDLTIKLNNYKIFKELLLKNNPFTLLHYEMIQYQI
jgi:hypothetical protein